MPRRSGRCSPLSLTIAHISAQTGGHLRANRRDRDAFVDGVFRTMGLGVYRQWVRRSYDPAAIAHGIEDALTP
ncbi:MAG: DUF2726 domain-containing protein [Chloroflexi bacterium]|nr:MAG: DUF2726 domain-containing protein [Chloroflexota bacterium]